MKHGFTLIELVVYMAILGFIVVVAGRVFSDSTAMRVRSQNMVKVAEEVGKTANFIAQDISQMGAKAWMKDSSSVIYDDKLYMGPDDKSSFKLSRGEKFDTLAFRRPAMDGDGSFLCAMEITWFVNDKHELYRTCESTPPSGCLAECPYKDTVLVAKNIRKFSFYASAPGSSPGAGTSAGALSPDTVFPTPFTSSFNLISAADGGNVIAISPASQSFARVSFSRFPARNIMDTQNQGNDKYHEVYLTEAGSNMSNCLEIPIKKSESWVVEFNMPFPAGGSGDDARLDSSSTQILPHKDHIAVGLRKVQGNLGTAINNVSPYVSPDVVFYASVDASAEAHSRYAEFFAKEDAKPGDKICVALIFSFYNPMAGDGMLTFSNFLVYKKPTASYHFVKESNGYESGFAEIYATEKSYADKLKHKRNVKAFELLLEIDHNGEVAGTYSKGETGMAVLVPNNGVVQ
ncbi:MAG: prepilin-type N-terminal cleavage/methylation domain-containing protein [Fibromonadales bacterium]|nr:prepilin-type N-terminal cleavage/methylation domain-containing protein [Fibromonadales bacterium]